MALPQKKCIVITTQFNLDKDVTAMCSDEFWERLDSIVGVLTHMNLQS